MVFVAIVGLDFWAIRTLMDDRNQIVTRAGIVGLPMTNILLFVPLVSHSFRRRRRFLWGFEVCGAVAVLLSIALMIYEPEFWFDYMRLITVPLTRAWGTPVDWGDTRRLVGGTLISLYVSLPQLAFALIGGFVVVLVVATHSLVHGFVKPPPSATSSRGTS
jgi:hypothetical protein